MPVGDLIYDASYFNGSPYGYGSYSRDDWPWERMVTAEQQRYLDRGFDITGRRVLVIGCAYGFLVESLRASGIAAWGIDISAYAIGQAGPAVAPYLGVVDARVEADIRAFKQNVMGLNRNTRIDLILTDDMLGCLTDADAVTLDTACSGQSLQVDHRVSVGTVVWLEYDGEGRVTGVPAGAPFYNSAGRAPAASGPTMGMCDLRTLAEWRSLLGPQPWISTWNPRANAVPEQVGPDDALTPDVGEWLDG